MFRSVQDGAWRQVNGGDWRRAGVCALVALTLGANAWALRDVENDKLGQAGPAALMDTKLSAPGAAAKKAYKRVHKKAHNKAQSGEPAQAARPAVALQHDLALAQTVAAAPVGAALAMDAAGAGPAGAGAMASGSHVWVIARDHKTLRSILTQWGRAAGYTVVWELPVDHLVEVRAEFEGTFEQAVEAIVGASRHSAHPFRAVFYQGNRVLRVIPFGQEAK
jgi:hypothetical protein